MQVIQVRHLSKKYQIYQRPWDKLREMFRLGKKLHREFWALQDISFDVEPGQTLGIIGQNGSGKSTLLQVLAGIMRQTRGDCIVKGKVSALLELGSGFNPEFTGRENVIMNGAILGFDTREMNRRLEAIARFAEIGNFLDQPVKIYSSGMFMRLAFAVAVNVDPDILLVDEALAVGDLIFQHRCIHRMNELRRSGKTIVFVTHDLAAVARFCDRAILLDEGHLLEDSTPDRVVQKYRALVFERERRYGLDDGTTSDGEIALVDRSGAGVPVARSIPNVDHRFGNGDASLTGVELLDGADQPIREVFGGQRLVIRVSVEFKRNVDRPILGFTLCDRLGVEITACNTSHSGRILPPACEGQIYTSDFGFLMPNLGPGSYSISPAVACGDTFKHDMCDWIDNALVFEVKAEGLVYGLMRMDVDVVNYATRA